MRNGFKIRFKTLYRLFLLIVVSIIIFLFCASYRLVVEAREIAENIKQGNIYKDYNVKPEREIIINQYK